MSMRKFIFTNDQFYHVFNRGANKQAIFLEDIDYVRFVHDLYEMNDASSARDFRVVGQINGGKASGISGGLASPFSKSRQPIVQILAWCLMPNHFHLMLRQKVEDGISQFMLKLGTAYTMYFNKKYERTGHIFQGKFKAVLVHHEGQFLHLSRYIHLNPVDLIESGWKEEGIKDWGKTHEFLENYRWSSYPDWIGKKNFPSIIDKSSMEDVHKDVEDYKKFIAIWLAKDMGAVRPLLFE